MSWLHAEGPRPKLPPLGDNLDDTVVQPHTALQAASTDTIPVESIPGSSTAPSSSRSAHFPALVPLAKVLKLEVHMATLLHNIHPWMNRSIVEAKELLERRMVQQIERKIVEVHQRFIAFDLQVLVRPDPEVDVSTLKGAGNILRADIDMILKARVPESEAPFVEPAEDTVMAVSFTTLYIPPPPP